MDMQHLEFWHWLIFGMFFVVASLSSLFVQERSTGALGRLQSLGVSRPMR